MTTRMCLYFILAALGLAMAGCGLSPVYGNYAKNNGASPVAAQMDQVYIDTIPDRSGQKLRNLLIDRFYTTGQKPVAATPYRLAVDTIYESIYGLGIAKDATATRSQIKLTTTFNLYRLENGVPRSVLRRPITAVSSFNTLASQYTTLVTEQDARDQVINDLGQQITTMVELYFTNPTAFPAPDAKLPVDDVPETAAQRLRREHDLENDYSSYR